MLTTKDSYDTLLEQLDKERFYNGNEYVCFDVNQPVFNKWDLHFVATDYEALEYCYEMTTDLDKYEFLSIRSVIKAMQEAKNNSDLMIIKNGWVDIGEMTNCRIEKLSSSIQNEYDGNFQKEQGLNQENNFAQQTTRSEGKDPSQKDGKSNDAETKENNKTSKRSVNRLR